MKLYYYVYFISVDKYHKADWFPLILYKQLYKCWGLFSTVD